MRARRFRAILTKFKRLGAVGVGIGAARAFEPAGLIHGEQRFRSFSDHAFLHQDFCRSSGRTPTACRLVVGFVTRLVIGHERAPDGVRLTD